MEVRGISNKGRSLKRKLILSYMGVTFIALIIMGFVFLGFIQRYARQQEESVVETSALQVGNELLRFISDNPSLRELDNFSRSVEALKGLKIELMTMDGQSLYALYEQDDTVSINPSAGGLNALVQRFEQYFSNMGQGTKAGMNNMIPRVLQQGSSRQGTLNVNIKNNGSSITFPLFINGEAVEGILQLDHQDSLRQQIIRPAMVAYGAASLAALMIAALLGWFMGRRVAGPLVSLSTTVQDMGKGNLSIRISGNEVQRKDEIGVLATRFNEMASELEYTFTNLESERDAMRNFLLDASHELRTPLTALIAYLELMDNDKYYQDETGESALMKLRLYLEKSVQQAGRMKTIVTDLLELARIEHGNSNTDYTDFPLESVIDEAVQLVEESANEGMVPTIRIEDAQDLLKLSFHGNKSLLMGVFRNVMENSIKFSSGSGDGPDNLVHGNKEAIIIYDISKTETDVRIAITDNGSGIPEDDIGRVFDRFYRSPVQSAEGNGLGLAIVKSVVSAHGGTVRIQNRTDGRTGVVLEIALPLSLFS